MTDNKVKFRLKGHESFQIREGWLRKGIKGINEDKSIFTREDATDKLGVGSNMVKSIRFWLQATGLTAERSVQGGKKEQNLTDGFGSIINEYDPYFEDIFTLWLIHYKLVCNSELATSWYLFFNDFALEQFTKEQMNYRLNLSLKRYTKNEEFSTKTLSDDCDCIIKTYSDNGIKEKNPEENLICPLTELGLIEQSKNSQDLTYLKKRPSIAKLDKLVLLYIILDNLEDEKSTSIDKLLNDNCNVGKVLNLDRNILNEYLDILKNNGYIEINRTAGLDKIYIINEISKEEVIKHYYKQL